MAKIGVYGGTFNPVHKMHVELLQSVKAEFNLDKIIVVPTFITPLKQTWGMASCLDRLNMLKLAFENTPYVEVSDYEINNQGKSYTYLTIEHFKNLYKNDSLFFILGVDSFNTFLSWKNPQKIVENAQIIYCDRQNCKVNLLDAENRFFNAFNKRAIKSNYVGKDVSSTKIRVLKSLNLPCNDLLTTSVEEYIDNKGLYLNEYYSYIKVNLKESRIIHTAGVIYCALQKQQETNLDPYKIVTACALHDIAKYLDYNNFKDFNRPSDMPDAVVHAFLGAHYAKTVLNICDQDILNAIKYHTSGRPNMSTLEKLVFTADMVEENRTYKEVTMLREHYEVSLEQGFYHCLEEELLHLIRRDAKIYSLTQQAYDFYKQKREEQNDK